MIADGICCVLYGWMRPCGGKATSCCFSATFTPLSRSTVKMPEEILNNQKTTNDSPIHILFSDDPLCMGSCTVARVPGSFSA